MAPIRSAVAAGGGPYTFNCDGLQTVVTTAEIVIKRDVALDGEDKLTIDGNDSHRVLRIAGAEVPIEAIEATCDLPHRWLRVRHQNGHLAGREAGEQ